MIIILILFFNDNYLHTLKFVIICCLVKFLLDKEMSNLNLENYF